jgi:hypothetical protein
MKPFSLNNLFSLDNQVGKVRSYSLFFLIQFFLIGVVSNSISQTLLGSPKDFEVYFIFRKLIQLILAYVIFIAVLGLMLSFFGGLKRVIVTFRLFSLTQIFHIPTLFFGFILLLFHTYLNAVNEYVYFIYYLTTIILGLFSFLYFIFLLIRVHNISFLKVIVCMSIFVYYSGAIS